MPTTGDAGYRYPNATVRPDVPKAIQDLAQDVARVLDSVPTISDLPAASNWTGRVKFVDQFPGVPFQWDGADWVAAPPTPRDVVTFTSSGSFSKASYPWLRAVRVRCLGGGGGGGAATATNAGEASCGAGGGGGGYAETFITDVDSLPASVTVTVGDGGTAAVGSGTAGTGGDSSFGAFVTADGGVGGTSSGTSGGNVGSSGGNGGSGTGDIVFPGATGGARLTETGGAAQRGFGGDSHLGFANKGGFARIDQSFSSGQAGSDAPANSGAGGTGAMNGSNQSARTGGTGGSGIVIVELYG